MSDSDTPDPYVTLTVTPDTGLSLVLDAMRATEELGRPFLIELDVSSATAKGDLHAILGSVATVKLTHPTKDTRYYNGIVARMTYNGLTGGAYRYRMELRPWIWLLSQEQDCCIFSSKSPWGIMTGLFRDQGFSDFADKRQNSAGDTTLDYCVQYRESTFHFVTRLMEQYGIYYYVTHADGSHTINFADDPNSHTSVGSAMPYRYDETRWKSTEDFVWDWSAEAQIQPGAFTYREYNFTTPKADLTAKSIIAGGHTYGSSEVYDYPGLYDVAADGTTLAQIQMQDLNSRRLFYGGTSNARSLGAGVKFTLSGFPDDAINQDYLVTHSVCTITADETRSQKSDDLRDTFTCVLRAVPGTRQFRLPHLTPRPVIRGPQTAKVTGEAGQEITTDQYGRIKVKFPWDRSAVQDENSSCWIRVAQIWAGTAWGAMFIPRIGQEVVVEFMEGNPDRPLVTGQVYNADMTVPYTLPDNKTRSTIKSNSSMGGGGFNELRFEDKKGSEEVFFQAQKDYNATVLNNQTVTITNDFTTTVKNGNRATTVSTGNDTLTVSQGDRKVTVSTGGDTLTVSQGDHTISVSAGKSSITAAQSITLSVGSNSIKIDTSGITLSGVKIAATADTSFEASGLTAKVSGSTELQLSGGATASLTGALVKIN